MWINGSVQANYFVKSLAGFQIVSNSGAAYELDVPNNYNGAINFKLSGVDKLTTQLVGDGSDRYRWYNYANGEIASISKTGAATFSSTVNSTGFLLNGNNLFSSLSTNYIPKWNGSNFVNSQIIEYSNNTKGFFRFGDATLEFLNNSLNGYVPTRIYSSNSIFDAVGTVRIESTTSSNSPTTGALVVGGGIGVGGKVYATGFATAIGTSSQYLMADGSVSSGGGVSQSQTTINGSIGGTITASMPFQTGSYKKVLIYSNALNGTASYTFPVAFSVTPVAILQSSGGTPTVTATSVTLTGAGIVGWLVLEGY